MITKNQIKYIKYRQNMAVLDKIYWRQKMIQSNGKWVVEEDEVVYGDYMEMVDRAMRP